MRRVHHILPVLILLIAASVLGGCITIKPGAFGPPTPTPDSVGAFSSDLTQPTILPSDVQQVLILGTVGIFDRPGAQYNQIGTTSRGQTYPVIGVSPDGQWWAVVCPNISGTCWVSANPTFVRPVTLPAPAPTATATSVPPTPRPSATPAPPDYPFRLQFGPGQDTVAVNGLAGPAQNPQYVLYGFAGDNLRVLLSSTGGVVNFSLRGLTDGVLYKSINDPSRAWTMRVPRSQDYLLIVASAVNAYFSMEVSLWGVVPPPPTATATATSAPVPSQPERISFLPGQESAVRSGPLYANTPKQFIYFGFAGQQATIRLSSPSPAANFIVVGVDDGIPYKSQGNSTRDFTFVMPRSQDYLITVLAPVNTSYTLQLIIPRPGPTPQPPPERISFAPGQTTAVRTGVVYGGGTKVFVFRALAGQTATIGLDVPWNRDSNFEVRGVDDGVVYKPLGNPALEWSFMLPRTQDYSITIFASYDTSYTLRLTIPPAEPTPTRMSPTPVPPAVVPPTVEPPTIEPPTIEPPTVGPPTLEPPTIEPPVVDPIPVPAQPLP